MLTFFFNILEVRHGLWTSHFTEVMGFILPCDKFSSLCAQLSSSHIILSFFVCFWVCFFMFKSGHPPPMYMIRGHFFEMNSWRAWSVFSLMSLLTYAVMCESSTSDVLGWKSFPILSLLHLHLFSTCPPPTFIFEQFSSSDCVIPNALFDVHQSYFLHFIQSHLFVLYVVFCFFLWNRRLVNKNKRLVGMWEKTWEMGHRCLWKGRWCETLSNLN